MLVGALVFAAGCLALVGMIAWLDLPGLLPGAVLMVAAHSLASRIERGGREV